MAISNVKLTVNTTNAKVGDTVRFTLTWDGSPDSDTWGTAVTTAFRGMDGFSPFGRVRYPRKENYASFTRVIPSSMYGKVTGRYEVAHENEQELATAVGTSNSVTMNIEKRELGFAVSINPVRPTINMGESAVFTASISGVEAPYQATYQWFYGGNKLADETGSTFTKKWDKAGTEDVYCDVTVTKEGYTTTTGRGVTKLTMANGTMDGILVSIADVPADVMVFQDISARADVSGVPENASVLYQWEVDGVTVGTESNLSFPTVKAGVHKIRMVCNVTAPDYHAVTVSSPIISVPVNKLSVDYITANTTANNYGQHWGNDSALSIESYASYDNLSTENTVNLPIDTTKPYNLYIDDSPAYMGDSVTFDVNQNGDLVYNRVDIPPSMVGNHNLKIEYTVLGDDICEGGLVTNTIPFTVEKTSYRGYAFIVNGSPYANGHPFYIKSMPNEEISITVENIIDANLVGDTVPTKSPEYYNEMKALAKRGTFQLIDKDGNVAVTAVDNVFKYTVPSEAKVLVGKIRHILDDGTIFEPNPYQVEMGINIEIVSNPMDPFPESKIIQTPNPVRLGQDVKYTVEFTNLPEGTNIDDSSWLVDGVEAGTGAELNDTANFDVKSIRNSTLAVPVGFDQALLTTDYTPNVIRKAWPSMSLELTPNSTTVAWGATLEAGWNLVGEELIEDPSKLTIHNPTWFLDGKVIDTLSTDGSLVIRATRPGQHTFKAIVLLEHPDYENGQASVEQTFSGTTEKRIMETTVQLLPTDSTVEIGKTQRFTATVTITPETPDAITTYQWFVNDAVQDLFTENYMDYKPTTEGTSVIRVVATTKAEGADDVVKESTTTLIAIKNVMDIAVVASTSTNTVKVGETYTATVNVTGAPSGADMTYKWSTGETTKDVSATATTEGVINLTCEVTVKAADYEDAVKTSNAVTITVESAVPEIPSDCPILYVHPLPHRSSAYIWCGWWVMDEIERLTAEGVDWKTAPETSKYQCHLATLAKMLYDYPEVDVQESRNGRIVHRSALEIGIIY